MLALLPAGAEAHGPTSPIATDLPRARSARPGGFEAQSLDGDLTMWMQVPAAMTVLVLDYRGAPYLRFSPAGVQVNHNSAMYYLNESPLPAGAAAGLTRTNAPSW